MVPAQSVGTALPAERQATREQAADGTAALVGFCHIAPGLIDDLWRDCDAATYSLTRAEFEQIVLASGWRGTSDSRRGSPPKPLPSSRPISSLRCAWRTWCWRARARAGSERAWERFIALYREPLLRAGIAITGNESLGRELADGLYAELYGLTERDGARRCPLESYSGRGSLIGWLRTTLAQRHVDRHRKTHREQPLDESGDCPAPASQAEPAQNGPAVALLSAAVREVPRSS